MQLTFIIPGDPKGLKRHRTRVVQTGARAFATQYDPRENRELKNLIRIVAREQYAGPLVTTAISLTMIAWCRRPKSHYGTGKNADKLKDSAPAFITSKPDLDNIVKLVEDGLTGVVWRDDSQVHSLTASKRYSDTPRIEVVICWENE